MYAAPKSADPIATPRPSLSTMPSFLVSPPDSATTLPSGRPSGTLLVVSGPLVPSTESTLVFSFPPLVSVVDRKLLFLTPSLFLLTMVSSTFPLVTRTLLLSLPTSRRSMVVPPGVPVPLLLATVPDSPLLLRRRLSTSRASPSTRPLLRPFKSPNRSVRNK